MPEPGAKRKFPQLEPGYRGYVAGVLDCDGAIWVGRDRAETRPRYTLRIAVSNTRASLPEFFAEKFGGNVQRYTRGNAKWKAEYRWLSSSSPAAFVIEAALPYLVVKRKQGLLALEFASTIVPGQTRLPTSWRLLRERIYKQMLELNKRGTG